MKTSDTTATFDEKLLSSYLCGTATPAEEEQLWEWLCADQAHRRSFAEVRAVWQRSHLMRPDGVSAARFVRSLNALNNRIDSLDIRAHVPAEPARKGRLLSLRRAATAVALAASVLVGVLVFRGVMAPEVHTYYNSDKTAMQVFMPDGTKVWLGSGTTLCYDDTFSTDDRHVQLDGEAYFDVAHDAAHPFVVAAPAFRIRVLGTVFNLRSFSGQTVGEVTLAEGSVAMERSDGDNLICLHPGQQAVYDTGTEMLEVNQVYVGNLLQLRYGVITLADATLPEIVAQIEKTFAVRLRCTSPQVSAARYNFSFQKGAPIEDVVDLLQFVSGCQFEIIQLKP